MSNVEYNSLLFQISRRLGELNEYEQLVFMCRDLLPSGSEDNQDVLSLFRKLEERDHLGSDRLGVMRDLLKGLKEWDLLGKVKKFESKRKEYVGLVEQIIRVLDELNDLERLITMCRGRIPEDIEGNISDVRSLFKELENRNCLGIDCLGIVKEILIEFEKEDLLKEVEEFEKRRFEDEEFESRKAQAAAVVSSVRAVIERVIGEVKVHCTFRKIGGALLVVGTGLVLRRCSSLEEFVQAFREATLPAANALRAISEGSVCFTVQAENGSALEALWQRYRDGILQNDLQEFLVTEEIRELADGEDVMVTVYIDEQEFRNALEDLTNFEQKVLVCPESRKEERPMKMQRSNSDSNLYCKALEVERPKETTRPDKPVVNQAKYLDQEKLAFVQSYLEKAEDARSVTTETSDSGMPGTHGAPSELGVEETSGLTFKLCLKDLSDQIVRELTRSLQRDPVALELFYQSFGLDQLHGGVLRDIGGPHPARELSWHNPPVLSAIRELFPDTPVRLLKDIFEALKLYDLAELLEKEKPRTLRPALPLKEIEKLPNASNRPTTFYSKAAVLIIDVSIGAADDNAERIGSFFKSLNSRNEVTAITARSLNKIIKDLIELEGNKGKERFEERREEMLKVQLRNCAQKREGLKKNVEMGQKTGKRFRNMESRLRQVDREESEIKRELEMIQRRKQWTNERKLEIEKKKEQKKEELQKEKEKFQAAVSTVTDRWVQNEDRKSTIFVIFEIGDDRYYGSCPHVDVYCSDEIMRENLAYLDDTYTKLGHPDDTKLVITPHRRYRKQLKEVSETLHVLYSESTENFVSTLLEILSKRLQSLDLISMMHEVKRTLPLKGYDYSKITVNDGLSSLPRLQKAEEDR